MNSREASLYQAKDVREGELEVAERLNLEMYELMRRAGQSVFDLLLSGYPDAQNILIVCGGGNNGGDGYVVAKLAKRRGMSVQLWQIGDPADLKGDAATAKDEWLAEQGTISSPQPKIPENVDLIIDGLLGTGLSGEVRQNYALLINAINQAQKPVISIDIPSGLCSDTGRNLGCVVKAQHTVSFIALKRGLFTGQAANYTGKVHFAGLAVDQAFRQLVDAKAHLITAEAVEPFLAPRERVSHKGNNGRVLCLGGDRGMFGAIRLTSEACARTGAGLTRVVTQAENVSALVSARPEVMTYDWRGNSNEINDHLEWADVIAIGPGLGSSSWGRSLVGYSRTADKPVVADADGLNLLARTPDFNNNRIITPHPGEAARLLNLTAEEVEKDRFQAVKLLQHKFGGVAVLKGAGTLIYDGSHYWICNAGNPGMASGGMGDVLTGIIAGLLGQGLTLSEAARAGVWIHSTAADLSAKELGERGMLASDLFPYIRRLVNRF
ncbi:NAD(P)H-hydrate dehydratase [Vibrio sp. JC009]|uniref:NAD(P)H-hydrate dehydratase n=1 Tax=Vibrio sp. JC009 TaxID=2912314 RepID=UPI0023B0C1BE|nr:NAD(P)H-hydrate dehydratase [Vibrio sp. JC009]WED24456.1 NAD(P)H-hydrate dehydratase [Vibrio sp. JC009]